MDLEHNESDAAESSTAAAGQDVQADEAEARSSGADQDVAAPERTMLDVVRDALKATDDDEADEAKEPEAESSPAEAVAQEAEESTDEPIDRDAEVLELLAKLKDQNVPLGKIQRFQEVLGKNKQLQAQWDEVAPAIERLTELSQAARLAGLTPDDMSDFYSLPLLAAQDPAKAREAIARVAEKLGLGGNALPPDLQSKVDDGYVDETTAREMQQLRREKEQLQRRSQIDGEDRQREAIAQQSRGMAEAVDKYQKSIHESDPDYTPHVHNLVRKELERLVLKEGRPADVNGAVRMAEAAYKSVKDDLAPMRQQPRPVSSPSGRRINAPGTSQPKSYLEAVQRGLDMASGS